jgi:hypothetical protein
VEARSGRGGNRNVLTSADGVQGDPVCLEEDAGADLITNLNVHGKDLSPVLPWIVYPVSLQSRS